MKIIPPERLGESDLLFGRPEVFAETWVSRKSFSLYDETPRPVSALFLVCTDIKVHFFAHGGGFLTAKRGDVVFIPKGTRYRVSVEGGTPNGIDTYTVNLDLLDRTGSSVLLCDRIALLSNDRAGLLHLHFQKLNEAAHGGAESLMGIKGILCQLLDALAAANRSIPASYYSIRAGVEALRADWSKNERIGHYAALCGVSSTYFYRCFREWSGKSPVEYRNGLRLSNAESMLRHTDMRIGEIAEVIGFEDPFYFCRLFTARYGISPTVYRRQNRH